MLPHKEIAEENFMRIFPVFLWIGNLKIYPLLNLIYIKTIFSHSKIFFYNKTAMTDPKSSLGRSSDAHKPSLT